MRVVKATTLSNKGERQMKDFDRALESNEIAIKECREKRKLKDIILNEINESKDLIFTFKSEFNIKIFSIVLKELESEGYEIIKVDDTVIDLYKGRGVFKGTIIYKIEEETEEDKAARRLRRAVNNLCMKEKDEDVLKNEVSKEKSGLLLLDELRLEKIDEIEKLNIRLQEIVNRGKMVSYPEKPYLKSLHPTRPNAKKGDIKEAFTLLFKILKNTYEVMIKIPKQQKQYEI